MEWFHLPITDMDVPGPAFEAQWLAVGASLRARLRDGFDVVVHCKRGCSDDTAGMMRPPGVRSGTDGGCALKPSDRWTISLCRAHHAEQHCIGEAAFERRYALDLLALAEVFARRSPHRHVLADQSNGRPGQRGRL